jgi:O-antigen/teichoic acid export membrane protein
MSIKKNFVYNTALTVLNTLFPLITFPYITRVLGPDGLGKFTFAQAFASNFGMFAILITPLYAIRIISANRDNKDALNTGFSGIMLINFITSLLSFVIFLTMFLFIDKMKADPALYGIISLGLLLNAFSIDWLFQGLENYKFITIRNFAFKLVFIALIFVFIREPAHYILYALFWLIVTHGANLINILFSGKYVKFSLKGLKITEHFKGIGIFFVINIFTVLVVNLDKTLMGLLLGAEADRIVGLYGVADKVVLIALSVTNSLSWVILPRVSYYFAQNRLVEFFEKMDLSVKAYLLLTLPLFAGTVLVAPEIVMLIGGEKYTGSIPILQVLSGAMVLVGFAYITSLQILVGMKRDVQYLITLGASLAVQAVALVILIPRFQGIGAAVGMLVGYLSQVIISSLFGFKDIKQFLFKANNLKYFFAAAVMAAAVYFLRLLPIDSALFCLLIFGGMGGVIYLGILLLLKEKILYDLFEKIYKRLFSRGNGGNA